MRYLQFAGVLTTGLASMPALAATVGYFDSKQCADPSGMEKCYDEAKSTWASCVNDNCENQNIDCNNVCSCIRVEDEINCAVTHCWNKVYSCEYQETAGDIGTYCLNASFENVPFFPPPDDAPGSCSCNVAKLLKSTYGTVSETEDCGANGKEVLKGLSSNDELQVLSRACICCSQNIILSSFYDICPDTDPGILGLNEIYYGLIQNEQEWSECKSHMNAFPCVSKLGYTPPGGDKSAKVYAYGEYPANGTKTTSNIAGQITEPVSGDVFTWTFKDRQHVVTVASADAKATGSSSSGSSNDSNSDSSNNSSSNNTDENSGNSDSQDAKDTASFNSPKLLILLLVPLALAFVM